MKLAFLCLLAMAAALKMEPVSHAAGHEVPAGYLRVGESEGYCMIKSKYLVKECRFGSNDPTTLDDCKSICDNDVECAAFVQRNDMKRCLIYTNLASEAHCHSLLASSPYTQVRSFQVNGEDPWNINAASKDEETSNNFCLKKEIRRDGREEYDVAWTSYANKKHPLTSSFQYVGPGNLEFVVGTSIDKSSSDYGCATSQEVPEGEMRNLADMCEQRFSLATAVVRRSDTGEIVGATNCCNGIPVLTHVSGTGRIRGKSTKK
eukprot:TRINITY_DN78049_c0_g1_i1.p1 TRINITY_DN78049_c0_g1~~TRINITY_DN78049_c0_g1_i1.p1  ORF type:complete len:262 (+),score=21.17 TRINITY_DN78049_c0_g1_i1:69-854(+)